MTAAIGTFYDPNWPTLQQTLEEAEASNSLPPDRRVRVRTALNSFTRCLGRPGSELPAHRGFVIQQVRRLRARPMGLSRKSLSNMRSELLFLIGVVHGRQPRSAFALSDPWQDVRSALGAGPSWWTLSRFAGYCSRAEVSPQAVTDAIMTGYEGALHQSGEMEGCETHVRRLIRVWNDVAAAHIELHLPPLTLPPQRRRRRTIEPSMLPESFRSDLEGWLEHLAAGSSPLSERRRRALKPATIRTRAHQLHKAASALVSSGRPAESLRSLADLVTIDSFKAAIGHLLDQQGGESSEALHGLAAALLAVAWHHVHVEEEVERRLAAMVANLDPGESGFRSRTRERLERFEDPHVHAALLHLPGRLFEEAKRASSSRRRSLLAQLAIATEILLFAPLRLNNLCMLRLGETFRPIQVQGERRWFIDLKAEVVKNRMARPYELPAESSRLVDEAMRLYAQSNGWIFPGRKDSRKLSGTLGPQIKRAVESRLGVAFNTHLYRAIAGCTHLKENPDGFESARALLGDRDDRVLRENYLFLSERHLIRHAQESIKAARVRLAPRAERKRKK